jgi:cytochrome subunit of sulfide dehydrogenase
MVHFTSTVMPIRFAVFIFNLFAAGCALAGTPIAEDLVKSCTQCHGATGVSTAPQTPHLNGQIADYLEQEISAIGSGERKTAIADHVAKTWTRNEISAVAKFYATSKAPRPKQEIDPQKVAKGAEIYKQRCADCHVDSGRQSDKDAPLMAAQDMEYMSAQTKLFVSGKRRFPFMMDEAYAGLNAEQLESVAQFFASQ